MSLEVFLEGEQVKFINNERGTSLAVQWLRLHDPMHRAWVRFLVRKLRSYMLCGSAKKVFKKKKKEMKAGC